MTPRRGAVEIVTIGTELLLGHTTDTNGGWIGARLASEGFAVTRRAAVADDEDAMRSAIGDALTRADVVLCTGGLGPTTDDFTKPVVAALYGRPLVFDPEWFAVVEQRFAARGMTMPAINRNQAEIPDGALLLPNMRGSAPGLILEDDILGTTILLPGVPYEMRGLMEEHVVPYLRERLGTGHPIVERWIRTNGISESAIAERVATVVAELAPLSVSFLPSVNGEDIRITCWGDCAAEEAERRLADAQDRIAACLEPYVYARDRNDLADIAGDMLRERGLTVAVAESCTGGLLAKRLTDRPGSSAWFVGGVVAYANDIKTRQLGVQPATIESHGAVSEECAREMAEGARQAFNADVAISITGIAGPGGGTDDKPVGTVWIAVASNARTTARRYRFGGDRSEIRARAAQGALALMFEAIGSP
jgi:nicotinamide-nucleotide amidase